MFSRVPVLARAIPALFVLSVPTGYFINNLPADPVPTKPIAAHLVEVGRVDASTKKHTEWLAGRPERKEAARLAALTAQRLKAQRSGPSRSGSLPSANIVACESGGSYTAENPTSSASGRYQIIDSTWNGYGGYSHASDAPPHVQDAKARELWNGGRGAHHWRECW